MNITLLTYGSRGDVQPFAALALGLQKAGHRVTLGAPQRFADFLANLGIRFVPLAGDPDAISQALNQAGGNVLRMVRGIQGYLVKIAPEVVGGAVKALEGADLVMHSFIFTTGAHSYAREMGIPDVSLQTFPMFAPTREFPNPAMPAIPPGRLSYVSHWLAAKIFWHGGNLGFGQLRRKNPADFPAKLCWPFTPDAGRPLTPLLMAYSPALLPVPEEWKAPAVSVTGYLFLEEPAYSPPEALERFLAEGEAPVCVTSGSMISREAGRLNEAALEALERTGLRGIFLTGWGGWKPEAATRQALFLEEAPHDWLFPQCRVIVHHGGAGTTAAGLRSGVPQVVVPHAADQTFWGLRVASAGAGPRPIMLKGLDADALVRAISAADSAGVRQQAQRMGQLIQAEDGVGNAVRLIEETAARFYDAERGGGEEARNNRPPVEALIRAALR